MNESRKKINEKYFEGVLHLSLAEAAKNTPYSQEYLSLLARRGKISARKLGRNWYITRSALADYLAKRKSEDAKLTDGSRRIVEPIVKELRTAQMNMPDDDSSRFVGRVHYVSLAEAAKNTPYSQEYLSLLARRGKIPARKFGRNWHITRGAMAQYLSARVNQDIAVALEHVSSRKDNIIKAKVPVPVLASAPIPSAPAASVLPLPLTKIQPKRIPSRQSYPIIVSAALLLLSGILFRNEALNFMNIAERYFDMKRQFVMETLETSETPIPSEQSSAAESNIHDLPASSSNEVQIGIAPSKIIIARGPTRSELLSAIGDFFEQGLPFLLAEQLKGPKGDQGEPGLPGIQSPSGFNIGAIYPTANNPNAAGTIGGITYFGAKELSAQTLTVSGNTTLANLTASGASITGALTAGTSTFGVTTLASLDVVGQTLLNTASVSADLEVSGLASASQLFGAGLTTCTGKLLWADGEFSCGTDQTGGGISAIGINEGDDSFSNVSSLSFSESGFNIAISGTSASISLDYLNGPASRSMANTWSALNIFSAGASVSTNLEVSKIASISQLYLNGSLFEPFTGKSITSNSLDFDELVDVMTLDSNLTIASAGYTWYFGSTNVELSGTASIGNTLFVQKNNSNVGIGTTSPNEKLEVDGNVAVSGTVDGRDISMDAAIWDNITSSARLYGGEITSNGDGTVSIDAGSGLIKADEAGPETVPTSLNQGQGSAVSSVSWDAVASLVLTDEAYNYIYYDADTDSIEATTDFYTISFTRAFTIGRVYRSGTTVVIRLCGTNAWNFNRRVQLFGEEYLPVVRAKGLMLSETGTQNIAITEGIVWAEAVNRFTINSFDSSGADTFTYWYRNGTGGWTSVSSQSQINNTQYDDGDGTLGTLTANRYGVHWVYVVHDSSVHVVYGQGDYTSAQAQITSPPVSLPGLLAAYATLIGKITIQKNTTSFTEVSSAFTTTFQSSTVTDHDDLSGLDGGSADGYYHLTVDQHSGLTGLELGYVPYATSTGILASSSIFQLSGNIGIGTTNPTTTLDVSGSASISGNFELSGYVSNHWLPSLDSTYTLGDSTHQWANLFATNASISNTFESNIASISQLYVGGSAFRSVSSNSLDFDELVDAMTLDADTTITGGVYSLTMDHASVSEVLEVGEFRTPYAQTIVVAKSGGDYTSIQSAYNYAKTLNPSITNQILVKVMPGAYNETLTIDTNYISIEGSGYDVTRIYAAAGNGNGVVTSNFTGSSVTFSRITVDNAETAAVHAAAFKYVTGVPTIQDNKFICTGTCLTSNGGLAFNIASGSYINNVFTASASTAFVKNVSGGYWKGNHFDSTTTSVSGGYWQGNTWDARGTTREAISTISGGVFEGNIMYGGSSGGYTISTVSGGAFTNNSIYTGTAAGALHIVSEGTFTNNYIQVLRGTISGGTFRGNYVSGGVGTSPTITGGTFVNNDFGSSIVIAGATTVRGGTITGAASGYGIQLTGSSYTVNLSDVYVYGGAAYSIYNNGGTNITVDMHNVSLNKAPGKSTSATGQYQGTYSIDTSTSTRQNIVQNGTGSGLAITQFGTGGVLDLLASNSANVDSIIRFQLDNSGVATTHFSVGVDDSDSQKFKISTAALGTNDRLIVDSSGNVGIANSNPTTTLDVSGSASISGNFEVSGIASISQLYVGGSEIGAYWSRSGTNTYLTNSGDNVGIGTAMPDTKLDVVGNILASTSGDVDLIVNSTSAAGGKFSLRSAGTSERLDILNASDQALIQIASRGTVSIATNTTLNATTTIGAGGFSGDKLYVGNASTFKVTNAGLVLGGGADYGTFSTTLSNFSGLMTFRSASGAISTNGSLTFTANNTNGTQYLFNTTASAPATVFAINDTSANTPSKMFSVQHGGVDWFTIGGSSGSLGLFDSTPDARLEVVASGSTFPLLMLSSNAAANGDRFIVTTDGSVGIGDTTPDAKLDVAGSGIFDNELIVGESLQVGGTASVAYSRFGTAATTHGLTASNDLLISSILEVDGAAYFDSSASISGNFEVSGIASISQLYIAGSAYTPFTGKSISSDSLDFDELVDAANLDANWSIASHGFAINFNNTQLTTGIILPDMTGAIGTMSMQTIGDQSNWFKDIYVESAHLGADSLYLNGVKILSQDGNIMNFAADSDQTIKLNTSGTGNLVLRSSGTGNLQLVADQTIIASTSSGITLNVPSGLTGSNVNISNSSIGGDITLNASGTGANIFLSAASSIALSVPETTISGNLEVSGVASISELFVGGTAYTPSQWTTSGSDIYYSGGSVGIGTASPTSALHIVGDTSTLFDVASGSNSRFSVLESGNVGVGTAAPGYALDVSGVIRNTGNIFTSGNNVGLFFNTFGSTYNDGIYQRNHSLYMRANSLDLVTIASSGNVGIGALSPTSALHIVGDTSTLLDVASGSNSRLIVLENGSIGIGTNAPVASTLLSIGGTGSVATASLQTYGSTADSTAYGIITRDVNSVANFYVRNDGAGYLKAAAWTYGSDIRLKENISYISSGLDKILQLKPVRFDYIDGVKNNLGFIAQDVQPIIPEAVSIGDMDAGYLSLKTDFIIPHLVKGMQEISERVIALEASSSEDRLARSFLADEIAISAGDIMAMMLDNPSMATVASSSLTIVGIASEDIMASQSRVSVVLSGQATVKVSLENGDIKPGDHLVLSTTKAGYAMKQISPGMSVGMALEPSSSEEPKDSVIILVNLAYWAPDAEQLSSIELTASNFWEGNSWLGLSFKDLFTSMIQAIGDKLHIVLQDGIIQTVKGVFGTVQTDKLCLEDICVNKSQLQELLQRNRMTPSNPDEGTSDPTASTSFTPTPEPSATPSPEVTASASYSPTPTPDVSSSPTPSDTPTPTPTPSTALTPTPEPSIVPSQTPTPIPTPSITPESTATSEPTLEPTLSPETAQLP